MSDYFDRVEQSLRGAVARRLHVPWYRRMVIRSPRALAIALACLVVTGSALAATGVFQTGAPVAPEVAPVPTTDVGVAIPRTVRLLGLRVPDPDGGPPWGLRMMKTTRGLVCVQLGRIVGGRIGALGEDGAFHDDGRFHPLSIDYLSAGSFNCATEDANGHAFLNEEAFGVPAAGLIGGEGVASGGCYAPRATAPACLTRDRRNVYYGLLGPDATDVTYLAADGEERTIATAGPDGAYLVVLPHVASPCMRGPAECSGHDAGAAIARSSSGETGGPTLNALGAVRAVRYRDGSSCRLPTGAEVRASFRAKEAAFRARLRQRYPAVYRKLREAEAGRAGAHFSVRERGDLESIRQRPVPRSPEFPCPAVGYAPLPSVHFTHAELATAIKARLVPSRFYCERTGHGETVPCGPVAPPGYREIPMIPGRHELLAVISLKTRIAISNFDRHYEINIANPSSNGRRECPGAGSGGFGPSNADYRVGQEVRFDQFVNVRCPGVYRVQIGLVSTDGPAGDQPVPGLPGQGPEVPVGQTELTIP